MRSSRSTDTGTRVLPRLAGADRPMLELGGPTTMVPPEPGGPSVLFRMVWRPRTRNDASAMGFESGVHMRLRTFWHRAANATLLVLILLAGSGCSIERYAIKAVGDRLASGGSVYETDDDPALIEDALPFGLKLLESLLVEQPQHRGMLIAAARGYVLYSYAFAALPAAEASGDDLEKAQALRQRARNLALRAHGYASRALAVDYPDVTAALRDDPEAALLEVAAPERDVPTLFWNAAALGLAVSAAKNEPALLARLPEIEATLARALVLDETWNGGALHELAISIASSRTTRADPDTLESHYDRAVELSSGTRASAHVTLAEAVAIPMQDRRRFVELCERALAIDVDAYPEQRLQNVLAQRRARWLLDHIDELFLE